jgi:hypothetical protein
MRGRAGTWPRALAVLGFAFLFGRALGLGFRRRGGCGFRLKRYPGSPRLPREGRLPLLVQLEAGAHDLVHVAYHD